jgi:type IV pilus assembly protein PilV
MWTTKKLGTSKGFTLVELLIAMTLLSIGILAMVQMQVVAIQSNSIANKLTVASSLAEEVMDDIQSWDINNPPVTGVFTSPTTTAAYDRLGFNNAAKSVIVQSAGTFKANYSVILVQPDLTTAFISVTVTGGGRTVTLTSIKRLA